jgi:hypothetical protein
VPPPEGPATEIGVVVADAWQGRGVGSALMRALISRAQARGVTSLSMDVLPANQRVLAIVAAHWPGVRTRRSADCVTVQVALPPAPLARTPADHPHADHPHADHPHADHAHPDPARAGRRELAHRG